ncbi:hypothetical protein [Xanthomonas sp. GPE 39]|uniref:hypothetical protein n=1 Tax=Xanthomonas sp. GPE 39 TaxID=1583099 RepID=UPI000AC62C95|nr:hypothetical protein [Xanthomonas sp. GPE 39]
MLNRFLQVAIPFVGHWLAPQLKAAGPLLALTIATASISDVAAASDFGGAAGLSSQLVDRGIALTRDTSVLQGTLFWLPAPDWSVSVSASSALNAPGKILMVTAGVSRNWTLSDSWQMQVEVLRYSYPTNRINRMFNRNEASLGWTYRDRLSISLAAFQMPDNGLRQRWYGAADLSTHQPLIGALSLSAGIGVSQAPAAIYGMEHTSHYNYGHAGLIYTTGHWNVELNRIFSNSHTGYPDHGLWPWVASVSRSF